MKGLLDREVLFFGGKGGVGKTTCAAAMALAASRLGRRVLLVSTDPAHSTSDIFERPIGPDPVELQTGLWGLEIDAATESAIMKLLQDLRAAGKTVLVVHHDLQTAREYFDMLILLNMRLVAFGPTEQVFTPELLQKTYGGRLTVLADVAEAVAQAERGTPEPRQKDGKRKAPPGGGGHLPTGL